MTDEEVFIAMRQLELASEAAQEEGRDDILAKVALVESEKRRGIVQ